MRSMSAIESKLASRRLKHELIMSELTGEIKDKNMMKAERLVQIREEQEKQERDNQRSLERSIEKENQRLARKGK